jgi:hypothetical protein
MAKENTISSEIELSGSMTPLLQEMSQREWDTLTPAQKAVKRCMRAKMGCSCSGCGSVGYWRRNCPYCPAVVYDRATGGFVEKTSSSTAPPPSRKGRAHESLVATPSIDAEDLGPSSLQLATSAASTDNLTWRWHAEVQDCATSSSSSSHLAQSANLMSPTVPPSPSHAVAKKGYLRQRGPEVLVHEHSYFLVLQRLAVALSDALEKMLAPFASSILRAPTAKESVILPASSTIRRDDKDFFLRETTAPTKADVKQHEYKGSYKRDDKLCYVFDRKYVGQKAAKLRDHLSLGFCAAPKGYKGATVHGVVGWRSTLTVLDRHATAGKAAVEAEQSMKRAVKCQGQWLHAQEKASQARHLRCKYLLHLLHGEMMKEQDRENSILLLDTPLEQKQAVGKAMKERASSADKIIRCLVDYGLIGEIEHSQYLIFTLNQMRNLQPGAGIPSDGASISSSSIESEPLSASIQGGSGGVIDVDGDGEMSPYMCKLTRPRQQSNLGLNCSQPRLGRRRSSATRQSSLALCSSSTTSDLSDALTKAFSRARGNIRQGNELDTTATPALIPFPRSLCATRGEEVAKSYVAESILYKARLAHIDPISGKAPERMLPLWCRNTEIQGGEQLACVL